jgi:polysaccharide export outer membrane protein
LLSPLDAQNAIKPVQVKPPEGFQQQPKLLQLTPLDIIREFEAPEEKIYHFGEGDEIAVGVWGRGELSGKHTVGPDGYITLPLLGSFRLAGLSREEAPRMIEKLYSRYYDTVSVTIRIERYTSNRVFVLGRVANPGTLVFDFQPTLLEFSRARAVCRSAESARTRRDSRAVQCSGGAIRSSGSI